MKGKKRSEKKELGIFVEDRQNAINILTVSRMLFINCSFSVCYNTTNNILKEENFLPTWNRKKIYVTSSPINV